MLRICQHLSSMKGPKITSQRVSVFCCRNKNDYLKQIDGKHSNGCPEMSNIAENSITIDEILDSYIRKKKNLLFLGPGGTGKCLHPETFVYKNSFDEANLVKANTLVVGDKVITPLLRTSKILSICSGSDKMYRIAMYAKVKTASGAITFVRTPNLDFVCNSSHNLVHIVRDKVTISTAKELFSFSKGIPYKYTGIQIVSETMKRLIYFEVVSESEQGEYFGFTLERGKRMFLIKGGVVTHNTHAVKKIVRKIVKDPHKTVPVLLSFTGMAAHNASVHEEENPLICILSGMTIHSYFCIGMKTKEAYLESISFADRPMAEGFSMHGEEKRQFFSKRKMSLIIRQRWMDAEYLIIDEISMVGKEMFELLNESAKRIRRSPLFMGGITCLFSGDFYQLCPVKDLWIFESEQFDAKSFELIFFNNPIRFADEAFHKTLMGIRKSRFEKGTRATELARLTSRIKEYEDMRTMDRPRPIQLYGRRADVDSINNSELRKIEGTQVVYEANDDVVLLSDKYKYFQIESMLDDAIPREIKLKVGATVMLRVNLDVTRGLCNGSRGVVTHLTELSANVTFYNGIKETIKLYSFMVIREKEYKGSRSQLPLVLSYAITIHKCQGLTLDSAIIDAGSSIFLPGQCYVACSRVKSLEGIYFADFDANSIQTDMKVIEYDAYLHTLPHRNYHCISDIVEPPAPTAATDAVPPRPLISFVRKQRSGGETTTTVCDEDGNQIAREE